MSQHIFERDSWDDLAYILGELVHDYDFTPKFQEFLLNLSYAAAERRIVITPKAELASEASLVKP